MDKKLLTYGFDIKSPRYNEILNVSNKFNIDVKNIEESDLNQKVGYLMGLPGYEKSKEEKNDKKDLEFLLFSDFDRSELSSFILELRKLGISIPHKSVITETTKDWDFKYLLEHIEVEHRTMQKFNALGEYVKKARSVLEKEENKELENALNRALELTKMKDLTEKDIDVRFEELKNLLV